MDIKKPVLNNVHGAASPQQLNHALSRRSRGKKKKLTKADIGMPSNFQSAPQPVCVWGGGEGVGRCLCVCGGGGGGWGGAGGGWGGGGGGGGGRNVCGGVLVNTHFPCKGRPHKDSSSSICVFACVTWSVLPQAHRSRGLGPPQGL